MTLPTLDQFRDRHGDILGWCGPEIDEYLDTCLAQLLNPTNTPAPALPAAA
ncbi:hypothetical protein [Streptomyces lateritius]|uniref:hypothetical protein n=1 Tax=Streptomyces lateritius TaxID=67313 RepID=UPI0016728157|nr:hypothetical protein [Streptomyces lateritius]GGU12548.1 hypothetical protein GCM10010272_67120 [Streptomyces lateritius]